MRDVLAYCLNNLKWIKNHNKRIVAVLLVLSLVVTLNVFWFLRRPGLTLAGDASCGILEHTHGDDCCSKTCVCEISDSEHEHVDDCFEENIVCEQEEHVHSIDCYSDSSADVETVLDWQEMFSSYPFIGDLRSDLVGVAQTQVGYSESVLNYEIGSDGLRRGYTRYGAWYGTPYIDWSAAFVSFCLNYAGADLSEYPGNIGAEAMAQHWNKLGKYAQPGEYMPLQGDLVFFSDNAVGIVAQVQNASIYVIKGDVENTVCALFVSLDDLNIKGWGILDDISDETILEEDVSLPSEEPEENPNEPPVADAEYIEPEVSFEETPEEDETAPDLPQEDFPPEDMPIDNGEPKQPEESVIDDEHIPALDDGYSIGADIANVDVLDITYGPAVYIFAGEYIEPVQNPLLLFKRFSVLFSAEPSVTQIAPYLEAYGGYYFFTLYDDNNQELPKDEYGNYLAFGNTGYKLAISFHSPMGFTPGVYQYQTPYGLRVDGGEGEFILEDGVNVGSWTVSEDGIITFIFNENMNSRSDIIISSTLGIHFPQESDPIDFDGKITVIIEQPTDEIKNTQIYKWGSQGGGEDTSKPDAHKIYWTVRIVGREDSSIVGTAVTDKIVSGEYLGQHHYTQSDMDGGLRVTAAEPNPNGGDPNWHTWYVMPGDANLVWTESGWSYTIPTVAPCWCGQVPLGDSGWEYYIEYTSTPIKTVMSGALGYMNLAYADNQYVDGWAEFSHGESHGEIVKDGSFVSDAAGGAFLWSFQVNIPAIKSGQAGDYYWHLVDNMDVRDANGYRVGYITNDVNLASVTANYHGTTINIPRVQDATEADYFAWNNSWSADNNGIYYGRTIEILSRCNCTAANCVWGGSCGGYWYLDDYGVYQYKDYCQCWTETQDITFTFTYKTTDLSLLESFGNQGSSLRNEVILYKKNVLPDGGTSSVLISDSNVSVPIPGLFDKTLTKDFDGKTAHYRITVNEAKLNLTNGTPLHIHDVMTDSLAFISGSLVITAEDAAGNVSTLVQDVDYTVSYDGTGNDYDDNGDPAHMLDIVILKPQPVKFVLDYDTTLIFNISVTEAVKYKNSAHISLWGEDITESTVEKVYANINISAKSYKVDMYKTSTLDGKPLPGATFGLFNEQGGLISSEVTDENGWLHFQTNVTEGIILSEHELYYMQELAAPPNYRLDATKHWFCFCDKIGESCSECDLVLADKANGFRIPFEQIGVVRASNEFVNYSLPATGGSGTQFFILVGAALVAAPLVYITLKSRKRERRGAG